MQQNEMESIWADGIPENINPEDRLEPVELLKLCLQFTIQNVLKDKGYEIIGVSNQVDAYPNLLLKKDNQTYAVAVVPCIYPYFIVKNDKLRIEYAKVAKQNHHIPVLCPIPVRSIDHKRAEHSVYLKGDVYSFANIGQKILTDEEEQEILPTTLDFHL